jgi:hypothetical protein
VADSPSPNDKVLDLEGKDPALFVMQVVHLHGLSNVRIAAAATDNAMAPPVANFALRNLRPYRSAFRIQQPYKKNGAVVIDHRPIHQSAINNFRITQFRLCR